MSSMRKSGLVAAASLLIAGASGALAATPKFPVFVGSPAKGNPAVRPIAIEYTGDGSEFFAGGGKKRAGNLDWRVWNAMEGIGNGYQWIDDCTPNCASGRFAKYPVRLKVFRPRKEGKYLIFTRLKVTYTGKKPGKHKTFTWNAQYEGGSFSIG